MGSFNNQHNCGMEVFVTPAYNLVVAVFNKKEYCCLSIINTGLQDGLWVRTLFMITFFHQICLVFEQCVYIMRTK